MATITLGPYTVTAQDQTRIVAAYQSEANTDINGSATPTQVLAYITKSVRLGVMAKVVAFENAAAAAAIVPAVPPVMI